MTPTDLSALGRPARPSAAKDATSVGRSGEKAARNPDAAAFVLDDPAAAAQVSKEPRDGTRPVPTMTGKAGSEAKIRADAIAPASETASGPGGGLPASDVAKDAAIGMVPDGQDELPAGAVSASVAVIADDVIAPLQQQGAIADGVVAPLQRDGAGEELADMPDGEGVTSDVGEVAEPVRSKAIASDVGAVKDLEGSGKMWTDLSGPSRASELGHGSSALKKPAKTAEADHRVQMPVAEQTIDVDAVADVMAAALKDVEVSATPGMTVAHDPDISTDASDHDAAGEDAAAAAAAGATLTAPGLVQAPELKPNDSAASDEPDLSAPAVPVARKAGGREAPAPMPEQTPKPAADAMPTLAGRADQPSNNAVPASSKAMPASPASIHGETEGVSIDRRDGSIPDAIPSDSSASSRPVSPQAPQATDARPFEALVQVDASRGPGAWRLDAASGSGQPAEARGAVHTAVPMRSMPVAEQMGVAIGSARDGSVELRLDPPELGRVQIHMHTADDKVRAVVMAERPETQDLLRRHAELLTRDLSAAGFDRVSLDFSGGAQTGGRQDRDGAVVAAAATGDETASTSAGLPELEAPAAPRRSSTGLANLDIRL
ncbi:flagellar hook-length control protein FliK [Rhodobacteraceae bacterium DSL-40]|uniref:flagellar hook-length control protein FliK n=1 Tax=Amaricoccus sp. B4 TaxID=3368557 RepID=UPI000DAD18B5